MQLQHFAGHGKNSAIFMKAFGYASKQDVAGFYVSWRNCMWRRFQHATVEVLAGDEVVGTIWLGNYFAWENVQSQMCMAIKKFQIFLDVLARKNLRLHHVLD